MEAPPRPLDPAASPPSPLGGGPARRQPLSPFSGAPTLALRFRSIPPHQLPAEINGMPLPPELVAAYAGHESLLSFRALHAPHCFPRFDAVRKCFVEGVAPHTVGECRALMESYRPCSKDLKRRLSVEQQREEEERRRGLGAGARSAELAQKAALDHAAAGAPVAPA